MVDNKLDQYANHLDSIKKPYTDPLSGMLSYSDEVNGLVVSQKFFPQSVCFVDRDAIQRTMREMQLLQDKAKQLKETVISDADLTHGQKSFLKNAIMETIVGYDMLLEAVWIEAQKGGFVLTPEAQQHHLDKIQTKEQELYGPRVSDVPGERDAVVDAFTDLYAQRGGMIAHEDQEVFGSFLGDMGRRVTPQATAEATRQGGSYGQESLWEIFSRVYEIYGEQPCRIHLLKGDSIQPHELNGVHYIPATWTSQQKKAYYEEKGIASHAKVCFGDTAKNVSVGYDVSQDSHTITFPSDGLYTWERICELMDHEIGTHYMRNENSGRGAAVRSAGYLQTEEGIAMTNEGAVTVLNLDDLTAGEPTIHHLSTFVAENYDYNQTFAILKAYFLMMGQSEEDAAKEASKRTKRVKRFHANDKPGANRKDVVYRRGKRQVVEFLSTATLEELQEWRDLMYQGKFGEADKDSIESLLGSKKPDFKMPFALGKILYQRSLGIKMDQLKMSDKRFQLNGAELNRIQSRKVAEILSFVKPEDKINSSLGVAA